MNTQKGFANLLILILITLIISGGVYLYIENNLEDVAEMKFEEVLVDNTDLNEENESERSQESTVDTSDKAPEVFQENTELNTTTSQSNMVPSAPGANMITRKAEVILNGRPTSNTIEKNTKYEYSFLLTSSDIQKNNHPEEPGAGDYGIFMYYKNGENVSLELINPKGEKINLTKNKPMDISQDVYGDPNPLFFKDENDYTMVYKIRKFIPGKYTLIAYNNGNKNVEFTTTVAGGSNIYGLTLSQSISVPPNTNFNLKLGVLEQGINQNYPLSNLSVTAYIYDYDETKVIRTIPLKSLVGTTSSVYDYDGNLIPQENMPFVYQSDSVSGLGSGEYMVYFLISGKDSSGHGFKQFLNYQRNMSISIE